MLTVFNNTFDLFYEVRDLPLTIASFSKKLVQIFYPNVFHRVDLKLEKEFREFYFGGHTEVFNFNILKNAIYYDMNSQYPHALCSNDFADCKIQIIDDNKIRLNSENILAYRLILTENQEFPLFPTRNNKRVYFMNGIKEVIATRAELIYLKEHNYLNKKIIIHRVLKCYYAADIICFNQLFEATYKIRKSFPPDHPYGFILKIFMNSGYGKFGQKPYRKNFEFLKTLDNIDIDKDTIYLYNDTYVRERTVISRFLTHNLFNALLTTSYARFELWKMLEYCRMNNIDVYYCDTDSIVISNVNFHKLEKFTSKTKLGYWYNEAQYEYFQAIDSKEYFSFTGNKFSIKYKSVKNELLNSIDKIDKHIKDGTKTNVVGSFFYTMRRKTIPEAVHIVKKHKRSYYSKRIINLDLTTTAVDLTVDLEKTERNNTWLILNQFRKIKKYFNVKK